MQIRAVEQWLDEGWSPWRIGYGAANLVALIVTMYAYARQPHHPGALWWLMAGVTVIAVWAFGEMLRWRIRYRRILISQHETSSEPSPRSIAWLLADGKELQANIGNHMAWWGSNRLLPSGVPGRIVRWEASVGNGLLKQPTVRTLFQNAPDVDMSRPISGQAYARLEYQLHVLQGAIDDGAKIPPDSSQCVDARANAALAKYYSARITKLRELHEDGSQLHESIIASEDSARADSSLIRIVQNWETGIGDALLYWSDLNRFGSVSTMTIGRTLSIADVRNRVEHELEALQTAMMRLQAKLD